MHFSPVRTTKLSREPSLLTTRNSISPRRSSSTAGYQRSMISIVHISDQTRRPTFSGKGTILNGGFPNGPPSDFKLPLAHSADSIPVSKKQTFGSLSGESVRAFLLCSCESGERASSEAFRLLSGPSFSK